MYTPNIDWVVRNALGVWGRSVYFMLCKRRPEMAQIYLRSEIDRRLKSGESSVAETAQIYNILLLPEEEFPQTNVRVSQ